MRFIILLTVIILSAAALHAQETTPATEVAMITIPTPQGSVVQEWVETLLSPEGQVLQLIVSRRETRIEIQDTPERIATIHNSVADFTAYQIREKNQAVARSLNRLEEINERIAQRISDLQDMMTEAEQSSSEVQQSNRFNLSIRSLTDQLQELDLILGGLADPEAHRSNGETPALSDRTERDRALARHRLLIQERLEQQRQERLEATPSTVEATTTP